jgi:hypothetical protein
MGQSVQPVEPLDAWKEPLGQVMHAVALVELVKRPAAHAVQRTAPAAENVPAMHDRQADAPLDDWKVPAEQLLQLVEAVFAWKVPELQLEQKLAESAEYIPAEQSWHELSAAWYWPAKQSLGMKQRPAPAADCWPAGQPVHAFDDASENVFIAHVEQLIDAKETEKVPALQLKQLGPPAFGWYVPSPQLKHCATSVAPVEER